MKTGDRPSRLPAHVGILIYRTFDENGCERQSFARACWNFNLSDLDRKYEPISGHPYRSSIILIV